MVGHLKLVMLSLKIFLLFQETVDQGRYIHQSLVSTIGLGSTASRFEFQGVNYDGYMCIDKLSTLILCCPHVAMPSEWFALQPGMSFRACITSGWAMDTNTSIDKLREIWSTKLSCRIFVLLQLEMTWFTASRYELQDINYHRIIE